MQNDFPRKGREAATSRKRVRRGLAELKVYQIADGRWIAPVRREGQRPHRIYGADEQAAYAARNDYYREVAQGLRDSAGEQALVAGKKMVTLADWGDHWLEHVVKPVYTKDRRLIRGKQPTTWANYGWHWTKNIRPHLGKVKLEDLRTSHVEAWRDGLLERGVAASSVYEARRTLVTLLNAGLERKHETRLTHNPASAAKMQAPATAEKAPPDPALIGRIIDLSRGHRLELAVDLALFLGLRKEEVAGLQWRDFDWEAGEILIRRRVSRVKGMGLVVRGGSKMRDDTHVARLPLEPLDAWKVRLGAHRQRVLEAYAKYRGTKTKGDRKGESVWTGADPRNDDSFLFTTETGGELLDPNLITRFAKDVFRRAGCPEKTFHGLRHDFAGILFDSDVPLLTISKLLRHKNIEVTASIYTHMREERARSVVGVAAAWVNQAQIAADGTTG